MDTSVAAAAGPDYVAKLFNGPKLVECRFIEELHYNLVQKLGLQIISLVLTSLKVAN